MKKKRRKQIMYFNNIQTIKLVGRLTGVASYNEKKYQELTYCFDTLSESDCQKGEIRGCELMDKTIFKTHSDCTLDITAYQLNEVDMMNCTKKQLETLKHCRLSKREQRFLNSLKEGDVITFWARIPNGIWDDPYTTYSCFCAWDFERCRDKKLIAKFESLLSDIGIHFDTRNIERR